MRLHDKCDEDNHNNLSYCFTCIILSRDRSRVSDSSHSLFFQPKIEESNSIVMLTKMETSPPQNLTRKA